MPRLPRLPRSPALLPLAGLAALAAACGEAPRPVEPVAIPSASDAGTGPNVAPAPPASAAPSAAATAEPPSDATGQPARFDRGAAAAALGGVSVDRCRTAAEPNLSGAVIVVFAPSGVVTSTKVEGPHAGTPIGGCVAQAYRAARVPPFDGPPITVRKAFHAP